jgi:hypothetical protein
MSGAPTLSGSVALARMAAREARRSGVRARRDRRRSRGSLDLLAEPATHLRAGIASLMYRWFRKTAVAQEWLPARDG